MNRVDKYFKSSVIALESYSSARDEYAGNDGTFLDANENPFPSRYNRYPDPYQKRLKNAIGSWRKVDPSNIFLGNGSDEIIDILIRTTCDSRKDRILCLDPSYGMYKVSAGVNEIPIDLVEMNSDMTVNRKMLFEKLTAEHKLIFICSPNNPNGALVDPTVIEDVLSKTNGLVIVDEAYIDFAGSRSWVYQLSKYRNLIVLQTFSKALGAAGVRLGMAFMHKELIPFLNKVKPPYNISTPNQEIALIRLRNIEKVKYSIRQVIEQRSQLRSSLDKLDMVRFIFPSEANFLLVRFLNADLVYAQLIQKKIIVRNRSNIKHCQDCLRISVGTTHENKVLIQALIDINSKLNNER